MKISLRMDPSKVLSAYGLGPSNRARRLLAEQVRRRCDKYVPYDTGQLKNTARVSGDGHYITYPQAYAGAQFHGSYRHRDPLRGSHWEKRMLLHERAALLREFRQHMKEGEH